MTSSNAQASLRRTFLLFGVTGWNIFVFPMIVFSGIFVKCGFPHWLERLPTMLPWFPGAIAIVWILSKRFRLQTADWIVVSFLALSSLPIFVTSGIGLVLSSLATCVSGFHAAWGSGKERNLPRIVLSLVLAVGGALAFLCIFPFPLLHTGTLIAADFFEKSQCR